MNRTIPVSVAFAMWSAAANADAFTDALVEKYQDMGFDFIEVKDGINQVKVEAVMGDQKVEVIYDRETGAILKQENEQPDADDIGRTGVDIKQEDKDFLDDDEDDEADEDDDENDESDDDESDDSDEDDEDDEDDESDESDDEDSDESDDDENDESDDES